MHQLTSLVADVQADSY